MTRLGRSGTLGTFSLLALLICASGAPAAAQRGGGSVDVSTVVTVLDAKGNPPPARVDKSEVNLSSGKTRLTMTGWKPVQPSDLQLAILIDNDVRTSILGQQVQDLAKFIATLPQGVMVGLYLGEYGSATPQEPLTTDHNAAVQKLRLSEGKGGDSPSIYQSLENLVTHWPAGPANVRREVLLLSSGIDGLSVNRFDPANDPYLGSALDKAQKAGVVVYSIYDGSSRFGGSLVGQGSQGKLIEVSGDTGGDTFMEGTLTPISIAGYLNALDERLASQYVLTFTIEAGKHKNGELREIQVQLEQHDLKPYYAHRVLVPGE
jgi:hypothetical protein